MVKNTRAPSPLGSRIRVVGCFVHPYRDGGVRFPITDVQAYQATLVFDGEDRSNNSVVIHQLKASCSDPLEIFVRPFRHRSPFIGVRAYS
jgi:hypothetical protein